jgi:DNA-binding transcriptional MocR family regulator
MTAPPAPIERDVQFVAGDGEIDLTWGHPDPAFLPADVVAEATATVLAEHGWETLSYGAPAGPWTLRNAVAEHLRRGGEGPVDPHDVLITAGASGGLDLVLSLLARPRDVVFVEQPTYFLALRILADHDLEVVALASDEHGSVPDDLDRRAAALGRSDPAPTGRRMFFYCIPTFANPTGRSLPAQRRVDLVTTARRHGVTVIEDDVYRDTAPAAPASMWSIDPRTVIRLGSFSKSLAPGMRVGFLTAERTTIERIERCGVLDSGGGASHFAAMVVARLLVSGAFTTIAAGAASRLAERRTALVGALDDAALAFPVPDGGFFVWLRVPAGVTSGQFTAAARRNGVLVADGRPFFAGTPTGEHVRASFSMLAPDQLTRGAAILNETARSFG